MNIVVLSGSPRKGANTDTMVEAFAETARQYGRGRPRCQQEDRRLLGMPVLLRP